MITAGVDVGSASAKALILRDETIVDWSITATTGDSVESANIVMELLLSKTSLSLDDIDCVVSTGYGRVNVPFADKKITEITCHATGAHWLFSEVRTILDIGGQDVKAIRCNDKGMVVNFVLNDKCAAGTGRYLERTATTLGLKIEQLGPLSLESTKDPPLAISSVCTVFAAEEMLRWLRKGEDHRDILAGATKALVQRLCGFIDRVGLEESLIVTGGVAKNIGVVTYLEKQLGVKTVSAPEPQIIGALGAALLARHYGQTGRGMDS
jgi:predicted CoA-substrate-specific enzyme activase